MCWLLDLRPRQGESDDALFARLKVRQETVGTQFGNKEAGIS